MTDFVQKFLLRNTRPLQYLINEKLAKRKGAIGNFAQWMEIGIRTHGEHTIPKLFRYLNSLFLNFGFRFNHGRPHITKWFTKEREIYITGYAFLFIFWAWFARKNRVRPLYRYEDYHLHDYDRPARLTSKFGIYIPFNVMNFKQSAHYLEINRIFREEMARKVILFIYFVNLFIFSLKLLKLM